MDPACERHRWSLEAGSIERPPSEYVNESVYATFKDDWSVRPVVDSLNAERIMWARGFSHGDGTYPRSREIAVEVTDGMIEAQREAILFGNAHRS